MPDQIANLPVGHLQLEGRAATAVTPTYATIGALAGACADVTKFPPRASGTTRVRQIMNLLAVAIHNDGVDGWDTFRKARPLFVGLEAIYFYSPLLREIRNAILDGSLARLHLSHRAIRALQGAGISRISSLIEQAKKGIPCPRTVGHLTIVDITEALDALSASAIAGGGVDWVGFAERRRFIILPRQAQERYSARDFLWLFPKTCEEAVVAKFGAVARILLRERIFRHPDLFVPLKPIGKLVGLTLERLRVLENGILKMLRQAIWSEEYEGCHFRFRPEFLQPLYDLANRVQSFEPGSLSVGKWRAVLHECWGVEPADLGQQTPLLFQLLGLETPLPDDHNVVLPAGVDDNTVRTATKEIRLFFGSRGGAAFPLDEICRYLVDRMGERAPDDKTVEAILRSLPVIEQETTSHHYRVGLEHLKNHVDRCERILRERGAPMHYKEVQSKIERSVPNALRGLSSRDLASRMANSKRFVAVGRSGVWSLREWPHLQTGTVAQIAAELLSSSKEPMSEKSLFERISPLRPLRRASIGTLLREDGRFLRVAPAVWTLLGKQH